MKNVGNVMCDSILYYAQLAEEKSTILKDLDLLFPKTHNSKLVTRNYYLATLHRAENADDHKKLKSILRALREIGRDIPGVLPLHPRTKKMIETYHLLGETKGIKLIDLISYLDMLKLEENGKAIFTDSGGVQKEAYWLRIRCFTLREETEWVETIYSSWNVPVWTENNRIVKEVKAKKGRRLLPSKAAIFGDGKASKKVVQIIAKDCC